MGRIHQPCFFTVWIMTKNLRRHTSVLSTLSLTVATVSADSSGLVQGSGTGTRMHGDWLADDEAIADELADGLAGVGVGNLVDFVGVEPDLALAAADDRRGQALLGTEVDPIEALWLASFAWCTSVESWTSCMGGVAMESGDTVRIVREKGCLSCVE